MKTSNIVKFIVRLVISLSLLIFIITQTDLGNIFEKIKNVNIFYVFVALFISALGIYIRAIKWHGLLKLQGSNLLLRHAHAFMYISLFFNNFFLGTLGGDGYRVVKTANHSTVKAGAVSAVIMDRFTGVLALVLIVLMGVAGSFQYDTQLLNTELALNLFIILCISLAVLAITPRLMLWIHGRLTSGLSKKYSKYFNDVFETLKLHWDHPKPILMSLLYSFFYQFTTVIAMYYFVMACNTSMSMLDLSIIVPLVSFLIMVPISVNGIGVQESVFYFFFQQVGIPTTTAVVIAILPRIGMLLFSLVGALLYIFEKRVVVKSGV